MCRGGAAWNQWAVGSGRCAVERRVRRISIVAPINARAWVPVLKGRPKVRRPLRGLTEKRQIGALQILTPYCLASGSVV